MSSRSLHKRARARRLNFSIYRYFNTVGSKEGWAPASFVSSRQNRAKDGKQQSFQQRPEDFMDEEDLREAEEAVNLQTANDFTGFGSTSTDSSRIGGLMDLFRPSGETIGTKLLKRMGWKEGQGIGPKIRRKANLGINDDADNATHLFAPDNPPMISFNRKNDHKGLGFEGEARLDSQPRRIGSGDNNRDADEEAENIFDRPKSINSKKSKQKPQRRGGFGVGVLNDTGSDDEDPYEMGPRISYNRVIDQDKKAKKSSKSSEVAKPLANLPHPLLGSKPVFISKKKAEADKSKAGFRKCHDGRLPLDGFLHGTDLAGLSISSISSKEKKYAPPEVPPGWKSAKQPSGAKDNSKYTSVAEAAKNSSLDPKSRAALLGEAQLPGKSIFDYMTPEGRDKIAKATGRTDLPPALGEKAPKGFESSEAEKRRDIWNLVPKLDKDVAIQALNRGFGGWMPYAEDEKKRARYRAFLETRAGISNKLPERAPNANTDEWAIELQEFARAAEVFKPISGMMASRFTSSSSQPGTPSDASTVKENLLRNPSAKPEDPAEAAARIGMYGPMTRTKIPFAPARLLCKRFSIRTPANVSSPTPENAGGPSDSSGGSTSAQEHGANKLDLVSRDVMNQLMVEARGNNDTHDSGQDEGVSTAKPQVTVDPEKNEALESERPGEAVFKAIFGSDDEDDG